MNGLDNALATVIITVALIGPIAHLVYAYWTKTVWSQLNEKEQLMRFGCFAGLGTPTIMSWIVIILWFARHIPREGLVIAALLCIPAFTLLVAMAWPIFSMVAPDQQNADQVSETVVHELKRAK